MREIKKIPDKITYDVQISSPYYRAASDKVTVFAKQSDADTAGVTNGKLSLLFQPVEAGIYPCSLTLTSPVDVRIYQIAGTGTAPNTRCSLEFHTHARSPVVQEIPIVNPTEKDWMIKATFTYPPDSTGTIFEGPREIMVKKKSTGTYNLTYKPDWVSE